MAYAANVIFKGIFIATHLSHRSFSQISLFNFCLSLKIRPLFHAFGMANRF